MDIHKKISDKALPLFERRKFGVRSLWPGWWEMTHALSEVPLGCVKLRMSDNCYAAGPHLVIAQPHKVQYWHDVTIVGYTQAIYHPYPVDHPHILAELPVVYRRKKPNYAFVKDWYSPADYELMAIVRKT